MAGFRLWKKGIDLAQTSQLEYQRLSNIEREIYIEHIKAVQKRKMTYTDPYTGNTVQTVLRLILNGECCGNGCRHCPYDHEKVPQEVRTKKSWNGAYYV